MIEVGQQASMTKKITSADITTMAILTGDTNPLHLDDNFASRTRFGQRIAHGTLIFSLISAVLGTKLPGPGTIYASQSLRFIAPVFIGDEVKAIVEVVAKDKNMVRLRTQCHTANGLVLDGAALVLVE